ncbi:hypothetical protein V7139_09580 [Neobacillus drentensis]|uniref:hypothetical protein n=1 Tax=Neobacillus drentensis TaxID=220684 RepID=UPI003001D459
MASTFSYNYKPMDYKTAQGQVAGQVDPLFDRAIKGVEQAKYQSDVQAGAVAAARGLGHSGLAADQLNKIAIAAQGQVGDLNAQRATQIAQQANDLVWRDKEFGLQDRAQKYNEFNSDRGYNYQTGRDKIEDTRYKNEWDYNVGRDKLSDKRYAEETKYSHNRDKIDDAWRQKEWNQMSPAEKAQMALEYSYSKKGSGTKGSGNSGRRSSGRRSSGNKHTTSNNKQNNVTDEEYQAYLRYKKGQELSRSGGTIQKGPSQVAK